MSALERSYPVVVLKRNLNFLNFKNSERLYISVQNSQNSNYFTSSDPHHDIYRFVPGKSSGILSDISSGILSGRSSGIF